MFFLIALLFTGQLSGKVVSVNDGNTIRILADNGSWKKEIEVVLSEIDAPELKQPYGSRSKQALSARIFGKEVIVKEQGKDSLGRSKGTIFLREENINAWMVKDGWAWHYKQYSESKELASLENAARQRQIGLWADTEPVPPWEWRKQIAAKRKSSAR